MTAGTSGDGDGYASAQMVPLGYSEIGSVTGDISADGGTVEAVLDSGQVWILNGNRSATNINIDGTDYAMTYNGTFSSNDLYSFTSPDFVPGNVYQITVT